MNMDIKWEYRVLIMGLGNYILGDEGAGVHLIRELEKKHLKE